MIGYRLALARKRKGLTQREAAERFGVSESAYKNYELNKRSLPHELLAHACEEFELDANWLLCGRGQIDQPELDQLYQTAILAAEDQFSQLEVPPAPEERLETVVRLVTMFRRQSSSSLLERPKRSLNASTRRQT